MALSRTAWVEMIGELCNKPVLKCSVVRPHASANQRTLTLRFSKIYRQSRLPYSLVHQVCATAGLEGLFVLSEIHHAVGSFHREHL